MYFPFKTKINDTLIVVTLTTKEGFRNIDVNGSKVYLGTPVFSRLFRFPLFTLPYAMGTDKIGPYILIQSSTVNFLVDVKRGDLLQWNYF